MQKRKLYYENGEWKADAKESKLVSMLKRSILNVTEIATDSQRREEFLVNTYVPMIFFQPAFLANEMLIGGANIGDALRTRAVNIVLSTCLNDYGFRMRDKVSGESMLNPGASSKARQFGKDVVLGALTAFPVYYGLMKAGGNEWPVIARSMPLGITMLSIVTAAYCSFIHDPLRRAFGTHPEQTNYKDKKNQD